MVKNTFDLFSYGLFGYFFAISGGILALVVVSSLIKSLKPKNHKKQENIIIDQYSGKTAQDNDEDKFKELDHVKQDELENEEKDAIFYQTSEFEKNEPVTYSDFCSDMTSPDGISYVEMKRKGEDRSYSVLKRKYSK